MEVVKGTGKGQSRSVSGNTASTLNTALAWTTEPDDTSEILVWIVNDVELSLTKIPKKPAANDAIVLLCNRPNGSPLTIGEHFDYRDYVLSTNVTVDTIEILNDVSKFAVNQTIFVGAKDYTREQGFMMRGNQWLGVHRRITAINSNILTIKPEFTAVPLLYDHIKILSLVDNASITTNGAKEMEYSESKETNPLRLANDAQTFLDQRKNVVSKYTISVADLYELDRVTWAREKFSIGDTIWVIDDDYGIDNKSVLVTSRSWNPNDPREVKIRADNYSGVPFREYADEIADLELELAKTGSIATWTNFIAGTPLCVHFDNDSKSCMKNTPPNFFCNSGHSARNGRTTKESIPLTTAHCESFEVPDQKHEIEQTIGVGGTVTGVSNSAYDSTHRFAVDIDRHVFNSSHAEVIGVIDENSPTSAVDITTALARIEVDSNGDVVSFDVATGTGCYVQVRRASGSLTLTVRALAIVTGYLG